MLRIVEYLCKVFFVVRDNDAYLDVSRHKIIRKKWLINFCNAVIKTRLSFMAPI